MSIHSADVALPPLEREAEESAEADLLREHELTLTKELGPLMGRSPRAVKKFVNLYRLLRRMRRGEALERFVRPAKEGAQIGAANFAAVQFWLAADCGLTPFRCNSCATRFIVPIQAPASLVYLPHRCPIRTEARMKRTTPRRNAS